MHEPVVVIALQAECFREAEARQGVAPVVIRDQRIRVVRTKQVQQKEAKNQRVGEMAREKASSSQHQQRQQQHRQDMLEKKVERIPNAPGAEHPQDQKHRPQRRWISPV